MKRFYLILFILLFSLPSFGIRYVYDFRDVPIAKALASIVKDHPEAKITFIYDELENYTTSAKINTDDLKSAVKAIVGNNPISVTVKKKQILVEAMQKGKYVYTGILLNEYKEPVIHATVLLLNPQDSVVITYGITKNDGRFVIPCDRRPVIAKISSTGYQPIIKDFTTTQLGKIRINTRAINLEKVTITPDEARMLSDRTIFVPQQRQKNTSMTGIELLERIGIPQVRINPDNGSVETNTGKPVNLFIDYTEATNSDLSGMNIQDVKRVEYYEFPSDPRFLGKRYVVNFIMTRYEYGGYTRLYGYEYTISNNQNLQMNSRFQYKKMTFDIVASTNHSENSHTGSLSEEIFRLPQADGSLKEIERLSNVKSSKYEQARFSSAVKAKYDSDKVTIQNEIGGNISKVPENILDGSVSYRNADFRHSEYTSKASEQTKALNYRGSYYFSLPYRSSITLTPRYSYYQTNETSIYHEEPYDRVDNEARDKTHFLYAHMNYVKKLRKSDSFVLFGSTKYNSSSTRYYGSANSKDKAHDTQFMAGGAYNFNNSKVNGEITFGWTWDNVHFNNVKNLESDPLLEASIQYLFSSTQQINGSFHYGSWSPNASYKSENIIRKNHLMSYTGNENLVPCHTYDASLSYNWIPSNKGYLSIYGNMWIVKNRYVYNYEADSEGILRTICQPSGDYLTGRIGLSGRLSFLDGNLRVSGRVYQEFSHNGRPYNFTRFPIGYSLYANYYHNDFYYSGSFSSPSRYSDGFMVGTWVETKSLYYLEAGWANKNWNIRITANNFARWNWQNWKMWFKTPNYDSSSRLLNTYSHADFKITCTYIFNYGKKVRSGGEPQAGGGTDSGILRK